MTLSHWSRSDETRPLRQNLCERFKNEEIEYLFHEILALERVADFLRKGCRWITMAVVDIHERLEKIYAIRARSFGETERSERCEFR